MKQWWLCIALMTSLVQAAWVPSDQVFTYQGRLYDGGTPVNGTVDLRLYLWDTADPNTAQTVGFQSLQNHPVSDGYFTVDVNFEQEPMLAMDELFDGSDRWMEIEIRDGDLADPNEYQALLPPVKLEATPFAHVAYRLKIPASLQSETAEPTLTLENKGTGPALYFAENGQVVYGGDASIDVGGSRITVVGIDSTEEIIRNENVTIGRDETVSVGGRETKTVAGSSIVSVGGNRSASIGADAVVSAGMDMRMEAGRSLVLSAGDAVSLQEGVRVFRDPNAVVRIDGAAAMQPMAAAPAATGGYGKLFIDQADGKLYYLDPSGTRHDLAAVHPERISFSVKRNASYPWPGGAAFEPVDFGTDTSIWDNAGDGFNAKSGVFAAPADGLYSFHGSVFFSGLQKGDQIAAAVNAAGKRYRGDAKTAAGPDESVRADVTVYLQADDVVALEGYVQSSSSVTVHGASDPMEAFTYFNGASVD